MTGLAEMVETSQPATDLSLEISEHCSMPSISMVRGRDGKREGRE